jgi:hypothetical protein
LNFVTPEPVSLTIPEKSEPKILGNLDPGTNFRSPLLILKSTGLIDTALTSASNCSSPGIGSGKSPKTDASGPPKDVE